MKYNVLSAWISKHNPSEVWDDPFPNFISCTVEYWERVSNLTPHFIMGVINYPCLG